MYSELLGNCSVAFQLRRYPIIVFCRLICLFVLSLFLGLDDDALISAVKLRVNNSTVILKCFSAQKSGEITLSGDAVLVPSSTSAATSSTSSAKFNDSNFSTAPTIGAKISLCSRREVRSDDTFLTLWSTYLSRPVVDHSSNPAVIGAEISSGNISFICTFQLF